MTGRRNPRETLDGAIHEYQQRERRERGEKLAGSEADWLDRRGPAANVAARPDADTRRRKAKDR